MEYWDAAAKILGTLAALVLVLLLAWLLLRWMNKRMPGVSGGAQRAIKVLDRLPVGKNGTILLLRVQDKVLLVAVGERGAEKLYEFDDPDGKFDLPKPGGTTGFSDALKDAAKKMGLGKKDGGDHL